MKTGFVLPSCNYNIVLSEEDVKPLLEKGYVTMVPRKTQGIHRDDHGIKYDIPGHELMYTDRLGEEPVQFVCVTLENDTRKKQPL